jgi:hypothetical protein
MGSGIIIPIFKGGDINEAKNYNGRTLINIMQKHILRFYYIVLQNGLSNITESLIINMDSEREKKEN